MSEIVEHPFSDRFGRTIIDKKIGFTFHDGEIVCRGGLKKALGSKELKNYREEYVALDRDDVPVGWNRQKEFDYYYTPNSQNIISILRAKSHNPKISFTESFAIFITKKIKQAQAMKAGFDQVKGLTLDDEEAIKSLPDLYEKRVPDFLHQKIASRYGAYLNQCGLLEEQGLGKTKTAIESFTFKKETGIVDRLLVVGPLSVINRKGWGKQINEYAPEDYSHIFVRGTKEEKIEILSGAKSEYDIYLINYEGIKNILDEILSWVDDRTMVVLDESSKIKNFYADRTKMCIELGKLTEHKMILTGTPITQNAHDLFAQFYFLDGGDTFGTSYEHFLNRFFTRKGFKYFASKASLKLIHDLIFEKSIRFTKDVIKDLPEKTYQIREVEMTPLQEKFYHAILKQEMIRLASLGGNLKPQNVLVTILRLQQVTSGFIRPRDDNGVVLGTVSLGALENASKQLPLPIQQENGALVPEVIQNSDENEHLTAVLEGSEKQIDKTNPKLNELMDLLDELGEAPVVIWTRFKYDVFTIAKALEQKNISYITYIGGMNERQREESEGKFQSGAARVFLSIPSAGGFGMNLQRASYAIYYCNDYSLGNRLQSEDRVHRIGQKRNVSIIDICCKGTIDYKVLDVLLAKKEIADLVTGDQWKNFLKYTVDED